MLSAIPENIFLLVCNLPGVRSSKECAKSFPVIGILSNRQEAISATGRCGSRKEIDRKTHIASDGAVLLAQPAQWTNHPPNGGRFPMNNTVKALVFSAAVTGLLSGTAVRAQAQSSNQGTKQMASAKSGLRSVNFDDKDKHSCKGKNDCKGKGGCKSGDNGCKGQNSCKGKGGCATDGSKPPSVV
jgi:hypothetical protein